MICLHCNGTGHQDPKVWGDEICPYCDGTGKMILTNEEWFCGLSTEEKAKFFDKICYSAWSDVNSRFRDMADYTDWEVWLKEKHNGNT